MLVTFTANEHASAKTQGNIYLNFAAFTDGFSQNNNYLMFKKIISRILNIELDRYEKKSEMKNYLFK